MSVNSDEHHNMCKFEIMPKKLNMFGCFIADYQETDMHDHWKSKLSCEWPHQYFLINQL